MSDKKTKVDSKLSTFGTDEARAKATKDLGVPDPEPVVGEQLIKDAIDGVEKDENDDNQQENS